MLMRKGRCKSAPNAGKVDEAKIPGNIRNTSGEDKKVHRGAALER
jgi:hypothetical protein